MVDGVTTVELMSTPRPGTVLKVEYSGSTDLKDVEHVHRVERNR